MKRFIALPSERALSVSHAVNPTAHEAKQPTNGPNCRNYPNYPNRSNREAQDEKNTPALKRTRQIRDGQRVAAACERCAVA